MKRLLAIAFLVAGCASNGSGPAGPTAPPPAAVGVPFEANGWTITIWDLAKVEDITSYTSNPGNQLWVLDVEMVNGTGEEADVGTGFRIRDGNGVIQDATLINMIEPTLRGTLAPGGHVRGHLSFELPLGAPPAAIIVQPGDSGDIVSLSPPNRTADASSPPTLTPSLAASPSPSTAPTVKPKPTLKPADLVFGILSYEPTACWDSSLSDIEGHQLGGIRVNFAVKVTNKGERKSALIAIRTETTDWFDTSPTSFPDSWEYTSGGWPIDTKTSTLEGPAVLPGKSRMIKWHTDFLTPFDPHYTVTMADQHWDMWTKGTFCY